MENTTQQKRCSLCKELKDAHMMTKSSRSRDGLSSWCKRCGAEYKKRYAPSRQPGYTPKRSPIGTNRSMFLSLRNTCSYCGVDFGPRLTPSGQLVNPKKFQYCSRECSWKAKRTGRAMYSNVCATCSKRFETPSKKKKYCSRLCWASKTATKEMTYRKRAWRAVTAESCEHCGITGRLHHHHKDRDVTNNDISNIAILCPKCHRAEHKRMGDRFGRKPKITRAHDALLMTKSLTDSKIARLLGVCPQTVAAHRRRLGLKKSKDSACVEV